MNKFRAWLYRFMAGRYGNDALGKFLMIVSLVFVVLSIFFQGLPRTILWGVGLAFLVLLYIRMLSRNTQKRYEENLRYVRVQEKFLGRFRKARARFKNRKLYAYGKCPDCKLSIRVPKGKGRITITCPKCGAKFQKKT